MKLYLISDLIFFISLVSGMLVLILAFKIFGSTSKFIFKREHKELGNNKLSMISDLMMILIILYNIGIISWVALIFYQAP